MAVVSRWPPRSVLLATLLQEGKGVGTLALKPIDSTVERKQVVTGMTRDFSLSLGRWFVLAWAAVTKYRQSQRTVIDRTFQLDDYTWLVLFQV